MGLCIKDFQSDGGVVNRLEELQEQCGRWISPFSFGSCILLSGRGEDVVHATEDKSSVHTKHWHFVQDTICNFMS